jgi:hypothetical protein
MDKDAAASASKSDWFDCKMPTVKRQHVVGDPYDPSCIVITLQGDESTCKATVDTDGNACEWCSIGTTELCLNEEQATLAQQVGATCNDVETSNYVRPYDPSIDVVGDPYDPSCVVVTLQGDESTCKATVDTDGNACEWCSIGTTELCLNEEQATLAQQVGATCNDNESSNYVRPYDPSCIAVTLNGDESSCKSTVDANGNDCEWCSVGSSKVCLNDEQAQLAVQLGGSCNSATQTSKGLLTLFF